MELRRPAFHSLRIAAPYIVLPHTAPHRLRVTALYVALRCTEARSLRISAQHVILRRTARHGITLHSHFDAVWPAAASCGKLRYRAARCVAGLWAPDAACPAGSPSRRDERDGKTAALFRLRPASLVAGLCLLSPQAPHASPPPGGWPGIGAFPSHASERTSQAWCGIIPRWRW